MKYFSQIFFNEVYMCTTIRVQFMGLNTFIHHLESLYPVKPAPPAPSKSSSPDFLPQAPPLNLLSSLLPHFPYPDPWQPPLSRPSPCLDHPSDGTLQCVLGH